MVPLTLKELATTSGVSSSHLGRIERGERFPSARILRKIAKPLGASESELFTLAGYLPPQPATGAERPTVGQLDPYVASVLSQEPVEIQRAVITVLTILKSMAKTNDSNIGFAEYVRRKYPEVDEDTITMIEDILEHLKVAPKLK
jgi:transcriptional regulator with XRE-family HTH domain